MGSPGGDVGAVRDDDLDRNASEPHREVIQAFGVTIGPHPEAVAMMELEATADFMMTVIHAHPTLAEAMLDAVGGVYGMAINA